MAMSRKIINKKVSSLYKSGKKAIAWLIDPDKFDNSPEFESSFAWVRDTPLDFIFVGGSQFDKDNFQEVVSVMKRIAGEIPVVIFPGSQLQLSQEADAILFLSLISGRNPEYLIGQQIMAAPAIHRLGLEVLPTGYLLINDQEVTSVHYVSQTLPLPNNRPELAKATALAGKYLGMRYFFLDAGSGASMPVAQSVIAAVKNATSCPLIVGGGIDTLEKLQLAFEGGADLVVIGNAVEKNPDFLAEVLDYKRWFNLSLNVN